MNLKKKTKIEDLVKNSKKIKLQNLKQFQT